MSNAENPFGSARFATPEEIKRAGMFRKSSGGLYAGLIGGRPVYYHSAAGGVLFGGARSNKFTDWVVHNICTGNDHSHLILLDVKGEGAAVSRDLSSDRKHQRFINPFGLHGSPQDRFNPVDYIRADSPSLISDLGTFVGQKFPPSGAPQAVYFEGRGRDITRAVALIITKRDGVLTLPALYRAISQIPVGGDAWLDIAFEMAESGNENLIAIEKEIDEGRKSGSSAFHGVIGEILNKFSCLADPALMSVFSPPYTFSMADLLKADQPLQIYIIIPPRYVAEWSPALKDTFTAAKVYKEWHPEAPRQTWFLDECGHLGNFPLISDLFTIDAGMGIRAFAVFQSIKQMKALGPEADAKIMSSAGLRQFFTIRDLETATTVSKMLGTQTLLYEDEMRSEQAHHAKQQAMQAILSGSDPFEAAENYAHAARQAYVPAKRGRPLMTPEEILGLSGKQQIMFADGVQYPILAERERYYEQRFMAGRYHPNPYHPPADRVRVKTMFGHGWKKVVREPVPDEFSQYPQYRDGVWSKVR